MELGTYSGPRPVEQGARSLRTERRKGLLFCPGCDHESPVDGDWIRSESVGRTRYACPACGSVVVSQPAF